MESYKKTGVIDGNQVSYPEGERLYDKPFAVIECVEEIPCDPCVDSCPFGAIVIEGNLNNRPKVIFDKCTGCAVCLTKCPGLAIFLIDYKEGYSSITIPYEFIPLPSPGEVVEVMDREGRVVGDGTVEKVLHARSRHKTPLVRIRVKTELVKDVRHFRRKA